MKRTNEYGIPDAIVTAVETDPYSRGEAEYSVTDLIKPPQMVRLWREHGEDVVVDVRDEVWRLLGQGVHSVLERAGVKTQERRLFATVGGVRISGQIDVLDGTKIDDYKVTSVYSYQQGLKPEWEQQTNLYAWLCGENGIAITQVKIIVILRDWMKSRAEGADYPRSPVIVVPVPLWTPEKQRAFVEERVALHTSTAVSPCTDEERWARGSYLHTKPNGKTKAYDTAAAALAAVEKDGGTVKPQEPTYVRCAGWCGVAPWCNQFKGNG